MRLLLTSCGARGISAFTWISVCDGSNEGVTVVDLSFPSDVSSVHLCMGKECVTVSWPASGTAHEQ